MKDWLHSILKVVDYERGKIAGFFIALLIVVSLYGCAVTTTSPISGDIVTPDGWQSEVQKADAALTIERADIESRMDAYNAKVELLAAQDASAIDAFIAKENLRKGFIDLAGGVATTLVTGGTVAWPSVLSSIIALGSVGLATGGMYDSVRKNKVIEKAKIPA